MGFVRKQIMTPERPTWEDVPIREYHGDQARGATKQVLIGPRDNSPHFSIRYFTIPVGEKSAYESHSHDHGVLITRGRARVLLGTEWHPCEKGDVVYIAPNEQHQFESLGPEPLEFVCVIPVWAEPAGRGGAPAPGGPQQ